MQRLSDPAPVLAKVLDRSDGRAIFGTDASGYHSARIGYPDELYAHLLARVGPHPRILEIGAGTGLATEALLQFQPRSYTIVESDPALGTYLTDKFGNAGNEIMVGPYPDVSGAGPYDLMACAAAFHWLDPDAALPQIRQSLAPDGVWAMWWNSYLNPGIGDPLADAIMPLLDGIALPPSVGRDGHASLDAGHYIPLLEGHGFTAIEHEVYTHHRTSTADEIRALFATYSFVRLLPEAQQKRLLDDIRHLIIDRFDNAVPNRVLTAYYSAKAVHLD